jgi:hypothetical protein
MATCTTCGNEIVPEDAFCGVCGAKQPAPTGMAVSTLTEQLEPPRRASTADVMGGPPVPPASQSSGFGGDGNAPPVTGVRPPSAGLHELLAPDELLGQAAPNTVYLGQRMMYEKEQQLEDFDPLHSWRYWLEMFRKAFLTWLIWAVGFIPIFIVGGILSLIASTFGAIIGGLLVIAWCIVMACVFWLGKLPGQLSEWKFSVDDRGEAAPVVFDHIAWALHRRNAPVDSVQLRRFKVMGQGTRDELEIRQGVFYALVSCLANGNDLYIGWTFWLYMSPARFLWTALRRLLWELRFRGHAIYVNLQFDRTKAFREALHSAVREGVDVAAGQVAPQGQGTVGSLVPVVVDGSLDNEDAGSGLLMPVTQPDGRL